MIIVFDKIGMVINGRLVLIDVVLAVGMNEEEFLWLVAVVEMGLEYLFGEVIVLGVEKWGIFILKIICF